MTILKKSSVLLLLLAIMLSAGCISVEQSKYSNDMKFDRLFCWGSPYSEALAEKYASAGVTDIVVRNQKQHDWARKYGMTPYWRTFLPVGPYPQVMTPEEQKHFDYISGADLDRKMPRSERMKILHKRRIKKHDRYGGEAVTEIATLNSYRLPCFISDENLVLSQKAIDKLLQDAPADTAGIFMDFIGYINHEGCYCSKCLKKYQQFISGKSLADTPQNKALFYRNELIAYYNKVIDYIKSKHPHYKIVVHIYPLFKADPLYGNRTKADYCGQTVSWYFKWDEETIRKTTSFVLKHAKDHYPEAEGIPFIGVNVNANHSLGYKTPEQVEFELRTILQAGGRTLMVCSGSAIIQSGYYEIFKKYCSKAPAPAIK